MKPFLPVSAKQESKSEDGIEDHKQKLPRERKEKASSFGRENPIVFVPVVVVAIPRVHVPLRVVGVPVDAHDEGTLVSKPVYTTTLRILSGLNLIRGFEAH